MVDFVAWGTTLFLIGFFAFVQVYCLVKSHRGRIQQVDASPMDQFDLLPHSVFVQLENGEKVQAQASACVLCMGRFNQGDRVHVLENNGQYTIGLPFVPCHRGKRRD